MKARAEGELDMLKDTLAISHAEAVPELRMGQGIRNPGLGAVCEMAEIQETKLRGTLPVSRNRKRPPLPEAGP